MNMARSFADVAALVAAGHGWGRTYGECVDDIMAWPEDRYQRALCRMRMRREAQAIDALGLLEGDIVVVSGRRLVRHAAVG